MIFTMKPTLKIKGDRAYIMKLAKHLYKEHPSTRRKIHLSGFGTERRIKLK